MSILSRLLLLLSTADGRWRYAGTFFAFLGIAHACGGEFARGLICGALAWCCWLARRWKI